MGAKPRGVDALTVAMVKVIRMQRAGRSWSRGELARESGIPLGTLRNIETGMSAIDVRNRSGVVCDTVLK